MDTNQTNPNGVPTSYVRLLHAVPNAPSVDIYANDTPLVSDQHYLEYSDYLPIPSGNYTIKVYSSGTTDTPVIDTPLFLSPNTIVTIGVVGLLPDLALYPIQEPIYGQNSGDSCLRIIHLAPDTSSVDVKLEDGTTLFGNVSYKNISNYICIPEGTYNLVITQTGSNVEVLTLPNVYLKGNTFSSIYAIGLAEETPVLKALLLEEPRYE